MELNIILASCAIVGFILSIAGFGFALFAFIEVQAQKRATHTVVPISNESSIDKLEEHLKKVTGQGTADLNRDLHNVGIDPDDLV